MNRKIVRVLVPVLIFMVLYLSMNWFVRKMVYPSPPFRVSSPPPKPFQEAWLDGKIAAWYYEASDRNAPALVYFHGNGENLETLRQSGLLDSLMDLKVSFLALDYPGYGRSRGRPSENSIQEAAYASLRWMNAKHPDSLLIACGWSLGAAVAIESASKQQDIVDGLIAMSVWSSLPAAAREHFPKWMVQSLLQESYDCVSAAKTLTKPALFIHGQRDTLIPAAQGKSVASAMKGRVRWVLIPNTSHNNLLARQQVWQEIKSFLNSLPQNSQNL
ncbi:alpha/beta hydrolase [bacterium]|nr:alpha/beta hydrolase [bacterium]MCI0617594.1 alpha/beta hydrolase [bacterium]